MKEVRNALRDQMTVSHSLAYFDHAAVAPIPVRTHEAMVEYVHELAESGDMHWLKWAKQLSELRERIAQLITADPSEIALVSNTTSGLSIVAESFPWQPGDNVVTPENEFPSNLLPWRNLERRGVEHRTFSVPSNGELRIEDLEAVMDSKTRLVSLSWVGFASGYRIDVSQFANFIHGRGCLLVLDAIQGLGAFPLNVKSCDVDFLAADGHKWMLGPEGAGLLYVKKKHLERLQPIGVGWNSLAAGSFDPNSCHLKNTMARFEGGSYNMAGLIGLGASLSTLLGVFEANSVAAIGDCILENVAEIAERLRGVGFEVSLPVESKHRSGIVGVSHSRWQGNLDANSMSARKHCLQHGIVCSVRSGKLRVSTHAYNNCDDIERLVSALTMIV
ncbi:MAG: aminotransferase class V-fold PLP-dependent enzyme [Planctomycetales bacterium]|nr:aminotransferase class V-fold PLP-dependent enzyme [Planctomycetales bacterium]